MDSIKIFNIVLLIFVYILIMSYLIARYNKEYVRDNWNVYKCKPYVMPFASSFNPLIDTATNFRECMYQMDKNYFDIFSGSLLNIFDGLSENIKSTSQSLNNSRGLLAIVRERLYSITNNFKDRFTNLDEQLKIFVIKLNDMFRKMTGIVQTTQYLFIVLANGLQWIFDVPGKMTIIAIDILIGLMALIAIFMPFLVFIVIGLATMVGMQVTQCFPENTLIQMKDGSKKKIVDLKIGDELETSKLTNKLDLKSCDSNVSNIVTSIMKFQNETKKMFDYNGIIVSGNHLVFHNNIWQRVSECVDVVKSIKYTEQYIYNIATTTNEIIVYNDKTDKKYLFSDYNEINDIYVNTVINEYIINQLNSQELISITPRIDIFNITMDLETQETGFSEYTYINGIEISKLKIGDYIDNTSYITGIIEHDSGDMILYNYKDIIVSASTPIYENNKYIRVYKSKYATKIINDNNSIKIYNITTNTGIILINSKEHAIIFLDFNEVDYKRSDNDILDIDTYITNISIHTKNNMN